VISDPIKKESFQLEIIKMSEFDSRVEINVIGIDKSTKEKDPSSEEIIRENKHYYLRGITATSKYRLQHGKRIQLFLMIRYESKGEIKEKKIFLNAKTK
jgi:hypothetical protein